MAVDIIYDIMYIGIYSGDVSWRGLEVFE